MPGHRITVSCQQCGTSFEVKESQLAKGRGKFCSVTCYRQATAGVIHVCQQCSRTFHRNPAAESKFCSRACSAANHRERPRAPLIPHTCEYCGLTFLCIPSKASGNRGHFCSRACADLGHRRTDIATRFWKKVSKAGPDDCWLWTGAMNQSGYGNIGVYKYPGAPMETQVAHRVSWELAYGPIPDDLFVCHHCDNPPCVNPAHLFLGTVQDNTDDMMQKGRHGSIRSPEKQARGGQGARAKLTRDDVIAIRQRRADGAAIAALAREYQVHATSVWAIVHRKRWKHV